MPMVPISPEAALARLKWRYAVKKFDSTKTIPGSVWSVLEESLVLAPSSTGLQPWKFVVVTNPEMKQKLQPAAYNQPQIVDCSHLVVICAKSPPTEKDADRHVERTAEVRGVPLSSLEGFRKMVVGVADKPEAEGTAWAARQAYIALGMFLTTAAMIGVDACPMEGFEPAQFDELLGLSTHGVKSFALAAAGYRAADDKYGMLPKVRFPIDDVIVRI
jgi:nitroreductase